MTKPKNEKVTILKDIPTFTTTSSGDVIASLKNRIQFLEGALSDADEIRTSLIACESLIHERNAKCIESLQAENERLVAEGQECHRANDELCKEHTELRKQIKAKDREIKRLKCGNYAVVSDLINDNKEAALKNAQIILMGESVTDALAGEKIEKRRLEKK